MRIKFIIALFAASVNAAPAIITRYHTAPAVTQWVTYTTNTVVDVQTIVATVSGPPPAAAEASSSSETSTVTPSATVITSSTSEAEATTPTTTSTSVPETIATTPTTVTTSTTSSTPTTPTTTSTTPTTTSTTPTTTSTTPTTTSTTPTTTSTTPTTTSTSTTPTTTSTSTSTTPTTTSTTPTTTSTTPTTTSTTPATTTSTTSSSTSASSTSSGLTSFESSILSEHNVKRALHGVGDLEWNTTLVEYAAAYAASSFLCDNVQLIHSGGPYGENLAAGYVGGAAPVDAWYDEISSYDYSNPGYSEATGHFTQVIWKATTQLGCAMVTCNNEWRQYTICEYSNTRGNIVGTDLATGKTYFEENVLPLV